MANITLQEMYDEWKKAAGGVGTPSDSAQSDPSQAATIIAALKGQLERLGDLLEQMQGNGTGAMPVQLTGSNVVVASYTGQSAVSRSFGADANTTHASVTPADYTRYKTKAVYIKNNTDQQITLFVYGAFGLTSSAERRTIDSVTVAAGSTEFITSRDIEGLNDPYPGFVVRASLASAGTGTYDVYLLGGEGDGEPSQEFQLTGSKVILQEDVTPVSIPAGSYVNVNIPSLADYSKIEAGFRIASGDGAFQSRVSLIEMISVGQLRSNIVDIIPSAVQGNGVARVDAMGRSAIVRFFNQDTGAAHNIHRYVAGVK